MDFSRRKESSTDTLKDGKKEQQEHSSRIMNTWFSNQDFTQQEDSATTTQLDERNRQLGLYNTGEVIN